MTSNWNGIVIGACLVLLQQGIRAQFLYPGCGLYDPTLRRIVNGKNALPGEAPFMAYVMKNNSYHCGGSIINHRYILTAAHCLDWNLSVRLGKHDDRTNPDCVGIKCLPAHEDFGIEVAAHHSEYDNVSLINDIAVLRLNRDIRFTRQIQPTCLYLYPESERRLSYTVFGWGWTTENGEISHILQTANLRRYYKRRCEFSFKTLNRNQICAGSEESDTCRGDSGSPLVADIITNDGVDRYVQLGIVSYGHRRCIGVGVYTYVPNYGTWIRHIMGVLNKRQRRIVSYIY